MAKKLIDRANRSVTSRTTVVGDEFEVPDVQQVREHGLVGDVVFEPPLTPEERRRRGVDVSLAERLEQIQRRRAEESDRG